MAERDCSTAQVHHSSLDESFSTVGHNYSYSQSSMPQRRQAIARIIHSIWTKGGADESALAPAIFDGRVDALGDYVIIACDHRHNDASSDPTMTATTENNNNNNNKNNKKEIERRHCESLDYHDFVSTYMMTNQPVLIDGIAEQWGATREWVMHVLHDDDGVAVSTGSKPNLHRLEELFGQDLAPVYVQSRAGFTINRPRKDDMTLSEYAQWWERHHGMQDNGDLLYLKDWKFVAIHKDYDAYYEWPEYFRDDWLNGAMGHAYKFVYLGPAGTSTRLHADVLWSFSWSTNVCGRKRWYLIPPEFTHLLYDCFGMHLASHLHADIQDGLDIFFPGLAEARQHAIEVIQEIGQTIFVPSGWHHTVENLEPTLSINHNWLNGTNIHWSWQKLRSELISSHSHHRHGSIATELNASHLEQNNDSAQVGDDLLLLWFVLSKKALSIISDSKQAANNMASFNLSAIYPILKEIRQFIQEGKDHGLTKRCQCNIDELISNIEEFLQ